MPSSLSWTKCSSSHHEVSNTNPSLVIRIAYHKMLENSGSNIPNSIFNKIKKKWEKIRFWCYFSKEWGRICSVEARLQNKNLVVIVATVKWRRDHSGFGLSLRVVERSVHKNTNKVLMNSAKHNLLPSFPKWVRALFFHRSVNIWDLISSGRP